VREEEDWIVTTLLIWEESLGALEGFSFGDVVSDDGG